MLPDSVIAECDQASAWFKQGARVSDVPDIFTLLEGRIHNDAMEQSSEIGGGFRQKIASPEEHVRVLLVEVGLELGTDLDDDRLASTRKCRQDMSGTRRRLQEPVLGTDIRDSDHAQDDRWWCREEVVGRDDAIVIVGPASEGGEPPSHGTATLPIELVALAQRREPEKGIIPAIHADTSEGVGAGVGAARGRSCWGLSLSTITRDAR